jgi:hypothetical protein
MERPICESTIKGIVLERHFLPVAFNALAAVSKDYTLRRSSQPSLSFQR